MDSVGAGVHEKVLVVIEGRAAGEALGRKGAPVDAAIIGIVDHVDVQRMTEQELRALVRDAIARHAAPGRGRARGAVAGADAVRSRSSTPVTRCSCCRRAPIATAPASSSPP